MHSEVECKHWSTAYALILSAETVKESISHTTDSCAEVCMEWLLQNIGCSSTNAPLWTLPYPRKIWEDTRPVKVNTAFCIPTSHSIQALVEFSQNQNFPNNLRLQSIEAATRAALYYAEHCFDSTEDGIVFLVFTIESAQFSCHKRNCNDGWTTPKSRKCCARVRNIGHTVRQSCNPSTEPKTKILGWLGVELLWVQSTIESNKQNERFVA